MPLSAPVTSATRRSSANGLLVVFAATAPEPQRAADRSEPGRDRTLVRAHRVVDATRDGVARLALHHALADLPGRPAEDGISLVQHSHAGEATLRGPAETY